MKKLLMIITCTLYGAIGLSSCMNGQHSGRTTVSIKDIQYATLNMDTVYVQMDIETCSYNGTSGVDGDRLYFLDQFFAFLYEISPSGAIVSRHLGLGNGPGEIPFRNNSGVTVVNNELLVMGNTYDAYLFKHFENRESIQLKISDTMNSLEDSQAYSSYTGMLRKNGDRCFYNIYSEVAYCNPVEHSEEYFKSAHVLMEVDLKSGDQKPIGGYSQYYRDHHNRVNHLFQISYDLDRNDNFYVSYQADSLIYLCDKKFDPVEAFGFQGMDMDTRYGSASPNWEDFNRVWAEDYPNKGYYTWIEHIDETGTTFRSYQKGAHAVNDGLQIYRDGVLIADVEVPKKFKVAGYIPPYYISQIICDEEVETMRFYKFRLD